MKPSSPTLDTIQQKLSMQRFADEFHLSLWAAAYKNLRMFVEHGLLREVSPHASTLLVEGNLEPHHHLVCTRCKAVQDIEGDFINFKRLSRQAPRGFD
jgi:Fe2+ or Zn2+ uptake regulation protein